MQFKIHMLFTPKIIGPSGPLGGRGGGLKGWSPPPRSTALLWNKPHHTTTFCPPFSQQTFILLWGFVAPYDDFVYQGFCCRAFFIAVEEVKLSRGHWRRDHALFSHWCIFIRASSNGARPHRSSRAHRLANNVLMDLIKPGNCLAVAAIAATKVEKTFLKTFADVRKKRYPLFYWFWRR